MLAPNANPDTGRSLPAHRERPSLASDLGAHQNARRKTFRTNCPDLAVDRRRAAVRAEALTQAASGTTEARTASTSESPLHAPKPTRDCLPDCAIMYGPAVRR